MSEFERARERADRKAVKRAFELSELGGIPPIERPPFVDMAALNAERQKRIDEVKPKAPKKRSNEIQIVIWVDGNEHVFSFKTNITGTVLGSQQSREGLERLLLEALRTKFGTVEKA